MCGFLNFLCKSVVPGRTFTRRLYSFSSGVTKPHHHIDIKAEMRSDLEMWLTFLNNGQTYSRSFFDFNTTLLAEDIELYTDAASTKGCGGYHKTHWFIAEWDEEFILECKPSINYLELYAVTIGVLSWMHNYSNKKVILFCDNTSVIHMVNTGVSTCRNCMLLLRVITLHCLNFNVKITLKHVPTEQNTYADLLSRLQYKKFRRLARAANKKFDNKPIMIPPGLWPPQDIWIHPTV